MTLTSKEQRQIMGRFATGVTLVTTRDGEDIWCITANAVLSLSLDPALILVAVDQGSRMHEHLTRGKCFAVNVLGIEQETLARRFAASGPKDFSDLSLEVAETGAPVFTDALAFVDCRLVTVTSGGDHDMFLGEPVAGKIRDGEPLIFYGGEFTQLARPGK